LNKTKKRFIKFLWIAFLLTFSFSLWAAIEIAQNCRAHHIFIARVHSDRNAITTISHTKQDIWNGTLKSGQYDEIIMNEPGEGHFTIKTIFSNGIERESELGYFTVPDSYQHHIIVGDHEDIYVTKFINLFRVGRDILSCAALR
jgi:hypothetical protein